MEEKKNSGKLSSDRHIYPHSQISTTHTYTHTNTHKWREVGKEEVRKGWKKGGKKGGREILMEKGTRIELNGRIPA